MEGCFPGVDWASEEHASCVVDADGRIIEGRRYRHDERGITALCKRLVEIGVELVAIERPDGLLIERLLDAGLAVIAIHPRSAMRPRFSAAGGKSDSFDSFVLAELARTDSRRYRILVPDSDATKAIRALTRAREDPRPDPRRVGERAARAARVLLARGRRRVRRHRQPDRAGVHQALPQPGRRARARRAAHGPLPRPSRLLRAPNPARAASAPQGRS